VQLRLNLTSLVCTGLTCMILDSERPVAPSAKTLATDSIGTRYVCRLTSMPPWPMTIRKQCGCIKTRLPSQTRHGTLKQTNQVSSHCSTFCKGPAFGGRQASPCATRDFAWLAAGRAGRHPPYCGDPHGDQYQTDALMCAGFSGETGKET
jgi:hypothetical protein